MNQALDETESELRELAGSVFERFADAAKLDAVETSPEGVDRELWAELARTGLLGAAIDETYGGLGLGLTHAGLVLEGVNRGIGFVPLAEALCAGWLIARHGTAQQKQTWLPRIAAGDALVAVAPPAATVAIRPGAGTPTVSGIAIGVPWANVADLVLLVLADRVLLVDPKAPEISQASGESTARIPAPDLIASDAPADPLGGTGDAIVVADFLAAWRTLLASLQAGITEGAVRLTAAYTSSRLQFGKPLSTFQGVALRAADAAIDARSIQATARQAAWTLDTGGDASTTALVAGWWAAEAGQRCVHATQHLHGGIGADVTYPVHRFFLWGKQIELLLGGASALLQELGTTLSG